MAIKEPVVAVDDFPIELWEDTPMRETAWGMLRDRVAHIAAERPGWTLTSDPEISREILCYFLIDDTKVEPVMVETTQEDAEFVKLRLSCWAAPAEV